MVNKLRRGKAAILLIAVMAWAICGTARGNSILLGSDYLATIQPTWFDFGAPIGIVPFKGSPVGPGNTDTIVQRLDDANLPAVGTQATIDIEMVELSLVSIDPVNVGGQDFDVSVHLDPAQPSTGQMTIWHDWPDNGTSDPEGTFSSFFDDVFFKAEFTPVGGGPGAFEFFGNFPLETGQPARWTHAFEIGFILVPGAVGDGNANWHPDPPQGWGDFFIIGHATEVIPDDFGRHTVRAATPEPTSLVLLGAGLAGLVARRKRKRAA